MWETLYCAAVFDGAVRARLLCPVRGSPSHKSLLGLFRLLRCFSVGVLVSKRSKISLDSIFFHGGFVHRNFSDGGVRNEACYAVAVGRLPVEAAGSGN